MCKICLHSGVNYIHYLIVSCVQIESEVVSGQSYDDNKILDMVSDTMYFGGFPGEHEFLHTTNEDFHGCIDNVVVSSISIDLSLSKETQGTVPGCPIEVQLAARKWCTLYLLTMLPKLCHHEIVWDKGNKICILFQVKLKYCIDGNNK